MFYYLIKNVFFSLFNKNVLLAIEVVTKNDKCFVDKQVRWSLAKWQAAEFEYLRQLLLSQGFCLNHCYFSFVSNSKNWKSSKWITQKHDFKHKKMRQKRKANHIVSTCSSLSLLFSTILHFKNIFLLNCPRTFLAKVFPAANVAFGWFEQGIQWYTFVFNFAYGHGQMVISRSRKMLYNSAKFFFEHLEYQGTFRDT